MTTEQRLRIETIAGKYFPNHPEWVDFVPASFRYLSETSFDLSCNEERAETIRIIKERIVAVLPAEISNEQFEEHVDIVLHAIEERL